MFKERQVIKEILQILYTEENEKGSLVVNEDKEWDGDTLPAIAECLRNHDYIPEHSVNLDPENQIAVVWDAEDVIGQAEMLFDEGDSVPTMKEARDIIERIKRNHDCNYGISWETINYYLHEWKEEKEVEEEG
jgi:hypothetical protein